MSLMNIYPVTQNDFGKVIALLKENNLPTDDISETTVLFSLYDNNELTGTIGLEHYGENGLIRSLCVKEGKRNDGSGNVLVNFIEDYAQRQHITTLYLLTTTAADYFTKRGYQTISRNEAPEAIQQTSAFKEVCPSNATIMKKSFA